MIIEVKVPVIGESVKEVTLSSWLKDNGAYVNVDDPICEFESDKATVEAPAPKAGKLIWVANPGDDIAIGAVFAQIDTSVAAPTGSGSNETPKNTETPKQEEKTEKQEDKATYATGHPSPNALKLMQENGLTAADIKGTGKDGRITDDDVKKAVEQKAKQQQQAPAAKENKKTTETPAAPVSSTSFSRTTRTEKMSRMRRTIARRLVSAKNNTAMLTTFNEVDLTAISDLRKRYQDDFVARYGIKLGFMSFFAKACAKVLMEMPEVNAQIAEDGENIVYHDYADISVAISTPTGLVVPPVHNVESLSLAEIEHKIAALAAKAREGNLTLQEMAGGTFTITNGGVFGSMMSTPILNEPQSAILGMHAIQQRPMVVDGTIQIRPMMYLALSYDHRIIDGSSSVTFLVKVKKLLEDPTRLFLDLK